MWQLIILSEPNARSGQNMARGFYPEEFDNAILEIGTGLL